jgi:hypothetical protein
MRQTSKRNLVLATAMPVLLALGLYACDDTLTDTATPQGVLSEQVITSRPGVEASLIGAYRSLDWNGAVGGGFGWAASNWVWGSVPSDDAYKGPSPPTSPTSPTSSSTTGRPATPRSRSTRRGAAPTRG